MTLFMYHSFFVLILANIMKMMPNMRNGQLLRMNDQRGGFGSVVGSLTTPSFIHISEKEIRTNIGSTVTLNCRIQNIRNHTVVIRIKDNYFIRFFRLYLEMLKAFLFPCLFHFRCLGFAQVILKYLVLVDIHIRLIRGYN